METLGELQKTKTEYSEKLLEARTTATFITIPQTTIDYKKLHEAIKLYTQTIYNITKLEQHKDEGRHIHIVIKFKQQVKLKLIHKIIIEQEGDIIGMINYQTPKKINATIQYLKKADTAIADSPYIEDGLKPIEKGRPKKQNDYKNIVNEDLLTAIALAENNTIEEALEHIKATNPRDYLLYKNTIQNTLTEDKNKLRKKYTPPNMDASQVKLTAKQQQVWDLLNTQPKQRRILWITGNYGSGKSFLYNYIKTNHEYGFYDAGQSASLDNIAYTYDEEGVIAWDIPRTYDFNTLGNSIANVIEKFSDFGQTISSKKYSGKTSRVLGHAIVFSNAPPLEQLKHRDIIHIDLSTDIEDNIADEINNNKNEEIKQVLEKCSTGEDGTAQYTPTDYNSDDDEDYENKNTSNISKTLDNRYYYKNPLTQKETEYKSIMELIFNITKNREPLTSWDTILYHNELKNRHKYKNVDFKNIDYKQNNNID